MNDQYMLLACGVVAAVSFGLYGAMMGLFWRTLASRRRVAPPPLGPWTPKVSLLRPLAGCDDDLDDNLESLSRLDYPSFEVLLGVADPADPACAVARRFIARHPGLRARILVTDGAAATNPKVAQLIGLERLAAGEVYVISDSNVRVTPTYLRSLVARLADPAVGMVTSLFSGTGEQTLGATLENLQICASTAPGIAATHAVSARPLTVGKSMALRRADLARLGGFASVGEVLAEDHLLGRRVLALGLKAKLSLEVVENRNVACSVARTLERHTRWARMRRSLFPLGFAIEPLLCPIVICTAALLVAPGKLTAALLSAAIVAQTGCALVSARLLRGKGLAWWAAPLEVVRAYVGALCWLRAWAGRRIVWRGHSFVLRRGSVIAAVVSAADRSPTRQELAT